mgnify:CR=1 FL=1
MRKQDLIFAILKNKAKNGETLYGQGTLEVLPDGFGFLRSADTSYLAGIMTGTTRRLPAKMIAWRLLMPETRLEFAASINTIALFTEMPVNATMPYIV